jgi:SET domain
MSSTQPQRLYNVQKVPDKGFGMIASMAIPKGTRILSESPLFRMPMGGPKNDISREVVLEAIAALSVEQKKKFVSLHNSYSDTDGQLLGRVRTNGLPLGIDGPAGGLFLEASRINHSCDPNAHASWNDNLEELTIHATKDIAKGDEVAIYYLSHRANRTARHKALQEGMRISCACRLCSLPIAERKKSDERLNAIQRLNDSLANAPGAEVSPLDIIHDIQRLLSLLADEEVADVSVSNAYYNACEIAISQADVARAKVFAERAAGARLILEGSDSPTVQKWQDFAENVTQQTELYQSS